MIERYIFNVHTPIVLGVPSDVVLKGYPQIRYCPTHAICNIGAAFVPKRWVLAGEERPTRAAQHIYGLVYESLHPLTWPILGPDAGAEVHGRYTGEMAPGLCALRGKEHFLVIAFTGWAKR